ncbi:MAG: hypothetical protein K6G88_11880, partial [Lachnospiraceae bacterium]|nr:hypothetical protein [Lachnospiraceae bacterium]
MLKLRNNKIIHVFILMFISSLYICINTYTMNRMDAFSLAVTVIGTISLTMIAYYITSKVASVIHIYNKGKVIFLIIFTIGLTVLSLLNLSQLHNDIGCVERNRCIQVANLGIDKFYLISAVILFIFPVCAQFVVDVFKEKKAGKIKTLMILCIMHIGIMLAIFGIRLATIAIVTVIDLGIVLYLMASEFEMKKRYLFEVSAFFALVILVITKLYYSFYPTIEQSVRHYFLAIPSEIRDVLYKNSRMIGMHTDAELISAPIANYDIYSALLEPLYNWGWLHFIIMAFLSIIMIVVFIQMIRTTCKFQTSKLKKIVALSLSMHVLLQQITSLMVALGLPIFIPIHGLFYQQDTRHFIYTTSAGLYTDIIIITLLVLIYLESSSRKCTFVDPKLEVRELKIKKSYKLIIAGFILGTVICSNSGIVNASDEFTKNQIVYQTLDESTVAVKKYVGNQKNVEIPEYVEGYRV